MKRFSLFWTLFILTALVSTASAVYIMNPFTQKLDAVGKAGTGITIGSDGRIDATGAAVVGEIVYASISSAMRGQYAQTGAAGNTIFKTYTGAQQLRNATYAAKQDTSTFNSYTSAGGGRVTSADWNSWAANYSQTGQDTTYVTNASFANYTGRGVPWTPTNPIVSTATDTFPTGSQIFNFYSSTVTKAANAGTGGATTLDQLTDVNVPTPVTGDFLKYSGTAWINDATIPATYKTITGFTTYSTHTQLQINSKQANMGITALKGNATVVGTVSGAFTVNDCLKIDSNNNIVTAGGACTTGGGGGTVSSGTTNQIAYYSSGGTVVSGTSTIPFSIPFGNMSTGLRTADVKTKSLAIQGTAGAGFITMPSQSSSTPAPSAGSVGIYAETLTGTGFTRLEQKNPTGSDLVLGRDTVYVVKAAEAIGKGNAVYQTSLVSGVPEVNLATNANANPILGIALDSIASGGFGQVLANGVVTGTAGDNFNTNALTINSSVYVSTAGGLTTTRPTGTGVYVKRVGTVLVTSTTVGAVLVSVAPFVGNMETGTAAATWTGRAIVGTTFNGNTLTTGSSTFTGTAGQTYTMPSVSSTLAPTANPSLTDAVLTYTGANTSVSFLMTLSYNSAQSAGSIYYLDSSGTLTLAKADAMTTTDGMLLMASTVSGKAKPFGIVSTSTATTFYPYSTGKAYYLSATVAGKPVKVSPSTAGQFSRKIGTAMSKTKMFFFPSPNVVGL